MHAPKFTLPDIRFADGDATFNRAQDLYQSGKVNNIKETPYGYSATVQGTQTYEVSISSRRIDEGNCTCYLGQNDRLCKHMLALGLAVLVASGKMQESAAKMTAPIDITEVKKLVTTGMKKLRRYTGPSRVWFSYQRSLATGARMITHAVSALPPSKENASYLWHVIERIDKKLANGVDDSDGVVGDCVDRIIRQLADYAIAAPELVPDIRRYANMKTNFDFGDDLRAMLMP